MTVTRGFVQEEDISEEYVAELIDKILPRLLRLTKREAPDDVALQRDIIEDTIYKVLMYINGLILPRALFNVVAEMSARMLADYDTGLSSEKGEGAVKRVQRGGFTQEFETKQDSASTPRGTLFLSDYKPLLNKFKKMRSI